MLSGWVFLLQDYRKTFRKISLTVQKCFFKYLLKEGDPPSFDALLSCAEIACPKGFWNKAVSAFDCLIFAAGGINLLHANHHCRLVQSIECASLREEEIFYPRSMNGLKSSYKWTQSTCKIGTDPLNTVAANRFNPKVGCKKWVQSVDWRKGTRYCDTGYDASNLFKYSLIRWMGD